MKRLPILCLLLAACTSFILAQTEQQKIDLEDAKAIHIYADFSSVEVSIGAQGVIGVEHNLTIDGEERSDLRRLAVEREGDVLTIREIKPDIQHLRQDHSPRSPSYQPRNTLYSGEEQTRSLMVDATLKVVVPAGIPVSVETEYGGILADNVSELISAKAKYGSVNVIYRSGTVTPRLELSSRYGAVDVTIPPGEDLSFDLLTEYGSLQSELDIQTDESASLDDKFYQRIIGKVGAGGRVLSCEAPYGNVYLREGE